MLWPPPPTTASCYICLENSADSNNQPLRRNCACRGDAGWAHVACLAEFAASKVTEAAQQRELDPSFDVASLWEKCILCKTPYMQNMGVAMAEAFVKHYEHLPDTTVLRFCSLSALAASRYNVGDNDGALEMYDRLQQMCDFMTSDGIDVRIREANILGMMGAVFLSKQQFNDALHSYERVRELYVALYGPNSPDVQQYNSMLVTVKERIRTEERGHMDPAAELLLARQRFKESQELVDISHKLYIHLMLVQALKDNGQHQEAMEQFEELLAESRQSLGPNHPDTLEFENCANYYYRGMLQIETPIASNSSVAGATPSPKKDVWAVIDCEQQPAINKQRVKVLRATKDAQKYICLIKNHNGVSSKFKVTHNQCILETGTMVEVHGLLSSIDLNGSIGIICSFDKEKRRYAVSVEKKKTAVLIRPINLYIAFETVELKL